MKTMAEDMMAAWHRHFRVTQSRLKISPGTSNELVKRALKNATLRAIIHCRK